MLGLPTQREIAPPLSRISANMSSDVLNKVKSLHWEESHKLAQDPSEAARANAFKARHVSKYIFPRQYGLENVFSVRIAANADGGKYEQFNRQMYDDRETEIVVCRSSIESRF